MTMVLWLPNRFLRPCRISWSEAVDEEADMPVPAGVLVPDCPAEDDAKGISEQAGSMRRGGCGIIGRAMVDSASCAVCRGRPKGQVRAIRSSRQV